MGVLALPRETRNIPTGLFITTDMSLLKVITSWQLQSKIS